MKIICCLMSIYTIFNIPQILLNSKLQCQYTYIALHIFSISLMLIQILSMSWLYQYFLTGKNKNLIIFLHVLCFIIYLCGLWVSYKRDEESRIIWDIFPVSCVFGIFAIISVQRMCDFSSITIARIEQIKKLEFECNSSIK